MTRLTRTLTALALAITALTAANAAAHIVVGAAVSRANAAYGDTALSSQGDQAEFHRLAPSGFNRISQGGAR